MNTLYKAHVLTLYQRQGSRRGRDMKSQKEFYAKHPQNIETPQDFVGNILGTTEKEGIVNPQSGPYFWYLHFGHLLVWVIALGLNVTTGFAASTFLKQGNWTGDASYNATTDETYYTSDLSSVGQWIGGLGAGASLIGVLVLIGVAMFEERINQEQLPIMNTIIQFFTSYGTVSTLYLLIEAAQKPMNGMMILYLIASFFTIWAQAWLSATMFVFEIKDMIRAIVPSLAFSVQFILMLSVNGGDLAHASFTPAQKGLTNAVPYLTGGALAVMAVFHQVARMYKTEVDKAPLAKSFLTTVYTIACLAAVYQLSYLRHDTTSPQGYTFALFSALLSVAILSRVYTD